MQVLGLSVICAAAIATVFSVTALAETSVSAQPPLQYATDLENAFTHVAQKVSPSVVSIKVELKRPQSRNFGLPFFGNQPNNPGFSTGGGSGVVISKDGYILTNNHVVQHATRIDIRLKNGKRLRAKLVGSDSATDLAVLKVQAQNLTPAGFASSDSARVGQWVVAIGSPFGLDYTVTTGVLSAKGRGGLGANEIEDYLQTDASINPGNSGGPLVDLRGNVLGINTMIIGQGTGIGFAIPSELAKRVSSQIIKTGTVKRAWLGVSFQELTPELTSHFGTEDQGGALVSGISPNGPAAAGGVQPGDLIVAVDDTKVIEGRDLLRAVLRKRVGDKAKIRVLRNGKPKTLSVRVGERPSRERADTKGTQQKYESLFGLSTKSLTSELAARLGYKGRGKVVVSAVTPGSNAFRAGLRAGDIILKADRKSVSNKSDIQRALSDGKALLQIERDGHGHFIALTAAD